MTKLPVRFLVTVTVVVLGFLTGLMEFRAREEMTLARQARAKTDYQEAIKHYSRAMNWYLPWGSAETAAEELLVLGQTLGSQGQISEAAKALARVRGGLYAARSLFTPRPDLIAKVEPILAGWQAKLRLGPEATPQALEKQTREYLIILQQPARPGTWPAMAAELGFILWVAATAMFIMAYTRQVRTAGLWAVLWAIGFTVWLWGLKWS